MSREYFHWKLGTINVRTGKEDQKLEQIVKEIRKADLSVCGLQEVRRIKTGSALISNEGNKYEIYWSGHSLKRIHGVGIVLKVDKNILVEEIVYVNARIIIADINVKGCSLRIINCYAPTEDDSESSKNSFYSTLKKQFNVGNPRKVICLGDFNATTSAARYNSSLRENVIIDDLDGKTMKVLDFILSCSWIRQYVRNCRVYNSFDFDSDHRLVAAILKTPSSKSARFIKRKKNILPKQHDLSALKDQTTATNFKTEAINNLNSVDTNVDNNTLNSNLLKAINETNTISRQPWHDDEKLKDLFDLKDKLTSENSDLNSIKAVRKKIRHRAKHLKNVYLKQEAEKINLLAINREIEKLFQRAKNQHSTLKQIPSSWCDLITQPRVNCAVILTISPNSSKNSNKYL